MGGDTLCWYRGEGTFGYVGAILGEELPAFMRLLRMEDEHARSISGAVHHDKFYAIKVYKQETPRNAVLEEYSVAKCMAEAGVGVPVHGVAWSRVSGHSAIVMDLMRCSLKEAVPLGIVTDAEVVAQQLVRKVSVMHARGVVHRDIKPANILVDDANDLYIADWGSAVKTMNPRSGAMYTTLRYAAPEVLKAGGGRLGACPAGDWWGVGCTIAFLLMRGLDLFAGSIASEQRALHQAYARIGGSSVFTQARADASPRSSPKRHEDRELAKRMQELAASLSPDLAGTLRALLNVDPERRCPQTSLARCPA